MRHVFLIFAAVVLSGCGTARHSPTHETSRESVRTGAGHRDSLVVRLARLDSVYTHDSVFVMERGDTVYKYVERVRLRYMGRADTVYKWLEAHDTVFVERRDSVRVEKPVRAERRRPWHEVLTAVIIALCCTIGGRWIWNKKSLV